MRAAFSLFLLSLYFSPTSLPLSQIFCISIEMNGRHYGMTYALCKVPPRVQKNMCADYASACGMAATKESADPSGDLLPFLGVGYPTFFCVLKSARCPMQPGNTHVLSRARRSKDSSPKEDESPKRVAQIVSLDSLHVVLLVE
ncbi:hypothetical protein BX666DRAFT_954434 [Dichotomocladium elegans]|nr:hypothetical protein BX666DRAFT_954434 [Dichotomocladium elegans]